MKTEMAEQHEDKDGFLRRSDMTLRDYFAGQALAMSVPDSPKQLAQWCYDVAAAMLEERK